jgi:hypothetical protein
MCKNKLQTSVAPTDEHFAIQLVPGDDADACEPDELPAALSALPSANKIKTNREPACSSGVMQEYNEVTNSPIADDGAAVLGSDETLEIKQASCSGLFSSTSKSLLESLHHFRATANTQVAPAQVAIRNTRRFNFSNQFFNREARVEKRGASEVCNYSGVRLLTGIRPPLKNAPKSPSVSAEGRKRKLSSVSPGPTPDQRVIVGTTGRRIKRSKYMPRRPLSANNLCFRKERKKVANAGTAHGVSIRYGDMSRIVSNRRKQLSHEEDRPFKDEAAREAVLYRRVVDAYRRI